MDSQSLQEENIQIMKEIRHLIERNTKLQLEMMDLNMERSEIICQGHNSISNLTVELKEVDEELATTTAESELMVKYICTSIDNRGGKELQSQRVPLAPVKNRLLNELPLQNQNRRYPGRKRGSCHFETNKPTDSTGSYPKSSKVVVL